MKSAAMSLKSFARESRYLTGISARQYKLCLLCKGIDKCLVLGHFLIGEDTVT